MNTAQNQSKNLAPLLIILVVLLITVGVHESRDGGWLARLRFWHEITLRLEETAPAGQMISGFPREFVNLAEDAKVIESKRYRAQGDNGDTEVLRVVYETGAGVPTLFAAYVDYLTDRGYSITEADSHGGASRVVAKNSKQEVRADMSISSSLKSEVRIDVERPVIQ